VRQDENKFGFISLRTASSHGTQQRDIVQTEKRLKLSPKTNSVKKAYTIHEMFPNICQRLNMYTVPIFYGTRPSIVWRYGIMSHLYWHLEVISVCL